MILGRALLSGMINRVPIVLRTHKYVAISGWDIESGPRLNEPPSSITPSEVADFVDQLASLLSRNRLQRLWVDDPKISEAARRLKDFL
jgi:hypothetical protein